MHRWTLLLLLAIAPGCTVGASFEKPKAIIDDGQLSGGIEITAIDGQPPIRQSHPLMTMVPFVLVEAGTHTFTLEGDLPPITAEVEADKHYHTALRDGVPALVEQENSETVASRNNR